LKAVLFKNRVVRYFPGTAKTLTST